MNKRLLGILAIGAFMLSGCTRLGNRPTQEEALRFHGSKQYNTEKGVFQNRRPGLIAAMQKDNMNFKSFWEFFKGGKDRSPKNKLPEVKPDLSEFLSNPEELKVIWFGHSSFLLNMDGKVILVDPVFSGSAAPVSFLVKRFQKPVLELSELPRVDYVVISHDHYDHLDMESIQFFREKNTMFIAPLGVGAHLKGWGIAENRIVEKDWWETELVPGLEFTATPAQHFSGRTGIKGNHTLWASWVIRSKNHKIYFSGDSGYDTHFKEIGDKHGPFDVAFIESGQYNKRWEQVHMMPTDAVKAYHDLKAEKYFPVHWGMFVLSLHSWYDPIEQIYKLSKEQNVNLLAPKIGQIVEVANPPEIETWWKAEKKAVAQIVESKFHKILAQK